MVGAWKINVSTNMPEKVATAVVGMSGDLLGAEYVPICYLGSQVANGINHAVLAEQIVLSGKDTKNIVLLVFNEKPNDIVATCVGIERIVLGGTGMGGVKVAFEYPDMFDADIKAIWDEALAELVGANIKPIALVATQMVNGEDYVFVAEIRTIESDQAYDVAIVTINNRTKTAHIIGILDSRFENSLSYAFTWLTRSPKTE